MTGRSPTFTFLGSLCSARRAEQEYHNDFLCKMFLAGENRVQSYAFYRATRRSFAAIPPSPSGRRYLSQSPRVLQERGNLPQVYQVFNHLKSVAEIGRISEKKGDR